MGRTRRLLPLLTVMALSLASVAAVLPSRQVLAADYWSITIPAEAGSDGSNLALEFGTKPGATDGFDGGGTDTPSAPPAPGAAFGSYFQITDPLFSQLNGDYRAALGAASGSTIAWTFRLQSSNQPIALNWADLASAGVPIDASLMLTGGGQTINMRTQTSVTYPAGTHTLTITATRLAASSTVPVDDDAPGSDDTQESTVDDNDSSVDSTHEGTDDDGDSAIDGTYEGIVIDTAFTIHPAQVFPDEEVTISANLCNSGEERGTRTVSLMVNGAFEQSQSVSISGGACQQVVFKTSRAMPGTYQVAIDGATGQFSVLAPEAVTNVVLPRQQTGLGTTGLIAIVIAVMVILIAALIIVFRRT